jgi:methyl-accepting chemotaxis protein/cytosine/uracil/thiamine/allantoin permease
MYTGLSFKIRPDQQEGPLGTAVCISGMFICLPVFMIGGMFAGGLSLGGVAAAVFAGLGIITAYSALLSMQSSDTGLPASSLAADAFGIIGAQVVTCLPVAVASIGWFGVQASFLGSTFSAMVAQMGGPGIPEWACTVFWGIVCMITAQMGYKVIKYFQYIAVGVMAVILIYCIGAVLFRETGLGAVLAYKPSQTMPLSAAIQTVVGALALGGVTMGDFCCRIKNRTGVIIALGAGYLGVGTFLFILGGAAVIAKGQWDITVILAERHPFLGLALLVLAAWTNNVINGYFGGVATSNMLSMDADKFPLYTGIACAVGTILGAAGIMDMISGFIGIVSSLIPPLAGVIIASYWIKKQGEAGACLASLEDPKKEDVNLIGITSFTLGALTAWLTANMVPFFIPPVNGIIVSFLTYLGLSEIVPAERGRLNCSVRMKISGGFLSVALITQVAGAFTLHTISLMRNETNHVIGENAAAVAVLLMVVSLSTALGLAVMFSGLLVRPVSGMSKALKVIAKGNLTGKIEAASNDELGDMMNMLKETQDGVKSLIVMIGEKANNLAAVGTELSTMMDQSATAVIQINSHAQEVEDKTMTQAASVTQTNAVMRQIVQRINDLNSNIEEQAGSIARSAAAIEEMVSNINSVTRTLMQNERNVQDLAAASEKGSASLNRISLEIHEVAEESENLLNINAVIRNIANQTNFLSMNAAIEAAHAGSKGLGFAVVAEEIHKLAESSSHQVKIVSQVLKKITGALTRISESAGTVIGNFEDIDRRVNEVLIQEKHILDAMEEQSSGSKEILETIGKSTAITQNVRQGSEEMLAGTNEVLEECVNLETLTTDLTVRMKDIAAGMTQINIAVARVSAISHENRESIEVLIKEISRFKIDTPSDVT